MEDHNPTQSISNGVLNNSNSTPLGQNSVKMVRTKEGMVFVLKNWILSFVPLEHIVSNYDKC